jgi:hypothetical protein
VPGHVTLNLCFCIRWDLRAYSAFRCARGVKHQRTIFHTRVGLVWFPKKCTGTRYAELVFLFPVRYVGHVVHCGTSGTRNIDALFFILRWDQCGFQKRARDTLCRTCVFAIDGICGSGSAFRQVWGGKRRHTIFYAQVDPGRFPKKAC